MNRAGQWLIASLGAMVGLVGGGSAVSHAFGGGARHAGSDPAALLQASESADQRVSYAGTKVLRVYRPGELTVLMERVVRVWHRSPDLTRIETVLPAESLGKIAVENGDGLWLFHPRHQAWRSMPWRSPRPRTSLLLRNYEVQVLRKDRVAGRPVVTLRVRSRYPGNPSKIVWVDAKTKVPLRQELFDASGQRVGSVEFREITFEASMPANLFTVPAEARIERGGPMGDMPKPLIGAPVTEPRYVPPGYLLVRKLSFRRPGMDFVHLRYTDGLNTISLFQERRSGLGAEGPCPPEGARRNFSPPQADRSTPPRHRRGPDGPGGRLDGPGGDWQQLSCGQRVTWTWGDTRYTLVGNISAPELRRMADSIPRPPQIASGARAKK
jgi:outer membrane lipoprotein-sorting protein